MTAAKAIIHWREQSMKNINSRSVWWQIGTLSTEPENPKYSINFDEVPFWSVYAFCCRSLTNCYKLATFLSLQILVFYWKFTDKHICKNRIHIFAPFPKFRQTDEQNKCLLEPKNLTVTNTGYFKFCRTSQAYSRLQNRQIWKRYMYASAIVEPSR